MATSTAQTTGEGGGRVLATLDGVVERITYVNPENGYTVAKVQPGGKNYLVAVVGSLPSVNPGESVTLTGRWDSHPTRAGEAWGCRLESYETDPEVEPDLHRRHTRLEFRLAD